MQWLTTQEIILNFVSSFGGTLSFVLSAIMITMILRSTTKLSKPLRRIIFGMTVFDLILSISDVTSSLPSPSGMSLLAVGNEITCTFQGAFVQVSYCY
jgi:glycerol uptake facilitator-like aquaporin